MYGISTLTSKGQATIPEPLRSYLGLVAGDKIYFEINPKEKTVNVKKASRSVVDELFGSMANSAIPYKSMKETRKIAGLALAKKYGLIK